MSRRKLFDGLTQVFNVDGSSNPPYNTIGGDSPLQWWKSQMGIPSDTNVCCSMLGCDKEATDGAHVIDMETGQHVFITPLCHEHNESESPFLVKTEMLVECTNVESQRNLVALNRDKYRNLTHR